MRGMSEPLSITSADVFKGGQILVTLSDGRTLIVTLEQILRTNPEVVPRDDDEEGEWG